MKHADNENALAAKLSSSKATVTGMEGGEGSDENGFDVLPANSLRAKGQGDNCW